MHATDDDMEERIEVVELEGQALLVRSGERARYSTPAGAEYPSACLPAFSSDTLHRDEP